MNSSPREARLNRLRIAACAVLLVLVTVSWLYTLSQMPRFYQRVVARDVPVFRIGGASDVSNAIIAARAASRGLTVEAYAAYYLLVGLGIAAGFWTAAGLVLWKHGGDWFRWFTALMLFFFPSGNLTWVLTVAQPDRAPYVDALALLWPLFLLFIYLFPNGQAVPRWSRWPMATVAVIHFLGQFVGFLLALPNPSLTAPAWVLPAFGLAISFGFVLILVSQVYRYLRVSGPVERRQIQWFVLAIAVTVLGSTFLDALTKAQLTTEDAGYLGDVSNSLLLLVPAAITISILRYRLWDIDVIIRRTLIYSVLTGLLALAYFGLVLVLQGIVGALTGESRNELVTVVSTLAIAALFVPLRGRVQRAIDQRFYRRKYDAARTLAAFGAQARDVVELEQLQGQLVRAVDETMQPEHVGLWVRKADRP